MKGITTKSRVCSTQLYYHSRCTICLQCRLCFNWVVKVWPAFFCFFFFLHVPQPLRVWPSWPIAVLDLVSSCLGYLLMEDLWWNLIVMIRLAIRRAPKTKYGNVLPNHRVLHPPLSQEKQKYVKKDPKKNVGLTQKTKKIGKAGQAILWPPDSTSNTNWSINQLIN